MRIGIACEAGPPPAELLDLLEAAGLPAAPLRGERAAGAPGGRRRVRGCWPAPPTCCAPATAAGSTSGWSGRTGSSRAVAARASCFDLRCCRDDLVFAVAAGAGRPGRRLRVATRHPETARRHFAAAGVQPDILTMDEPALAPALGLADGVVELATRLAAGEPGVPALEVREVVAACSARLVAARAARVLLRDEVGALVERLRRVMEDT